MYYRLQLLKDPEGTPIASEEISALDDVEAVHIARQMVGAFPLELWCGKRKVKAFPALEPEAA